MNWLSWLLILGTTGASSGGTSTATGGASSGSASTGTGATSSDTTGATGRTADSTTFYACPSAPVEDDCQGDVGSESGACPVARDDGCDCGPSPQRTPPAALLLLLLAWRRRERSEVVDRLAAERRLPRDLVSRLRRQLDPSA